MSILREFISLVLSERMAGHDNVYNYWMRRPHNGQPKPGDVGQEIKDQRQSVYKDVKDDFSGSMQKLKHDLQTCNSIEALEDIMDRFGGDAYELVPDSQAFDDAVKKGDLRGAKHQLLHGLKTWSKDIVQNTEHDDFNSSTLGSLEYQPEIDPLD